MKLTTRNKQILYLLLELKNYATINFIAEKINVSPRTALRELKNVEAWLGKNNFVLEKKKGIGIRINLSENERRALLVDLQKEKENLMYSPEQRLTLLKAELLKNPGITKLYTLTGLLEVTEATISSDMDKLENWMNKYHLQIMKRPGLGIYIEGSEIDVRSAIIALIYEQFHEAELIKMIFHQEKANMDLDRIPPGINRIFFEFMDISVIKMARNLLSKVEKEMSCKIADNSYIALVIRISVTAIRCRKRIYIKETEDLPIKEEEDKMFYMVKEWFAAFEDIKTETLPEEEINYLVIHIKGAEIKERQGNENAFLIEDTSITDLTREIIYIAERETGIYLEDNAKLLKGLSNHLKMAIYRIKMHLDIMNPLLEDIKEMYPDIYQAAAKCAEFIEKREKIRMPEDEIAFMATYIGSAVKVEKTNQIKIFRGAVISANDIGAAQLLVTEIEREFRNIKIISIASVMDMDGTAMKQKHIDILITTVELQVTELPVILVKPILDEEDKKKIRYVLENFLPESYNNRRLKNIPLVEKLERLKSYSDYILQLLHNFLFIEQVAVNSLDELYHFISCTVTKPGAERIQLKNDLKEGEKKGASILDSRGIALIQCFPRTLRELSLIVVRVKDSVCSLDKRGNTVKTDTFIILTMHRDNGTEALELVNVITREIINTDLSDSFKHNRKEDILAEINGVFDYFIQDKVLETNKK